MHLAPPPVRPTHLPLLDALRGAASLYVVIHHYVRENLNEMFPGIERFFPFGQVAVMVFFVLSGFVIHHSTVAGGRPLDSRSYLIRRFRRIYPAFVVALLVSYLAWGVVAGRWEVGPERLVGNLLMVHTKADHPGQWMGPYAGNHPLWSLAFEWWFYVVFLVVWRALGDRPAALPWVAPATAALGLLSYALAPNPLSLFLAFFPTWWVGVELSREWAATGRFTLWRQAPAFLTIVASTIAWMAMPGWGGPEAGAGAWEYPGLQARQAGSSAMILVTGYVWYRMGAPLAGAVVRAFGWFAPVSYAMYVLHLPALLMAAHAGLTPNGLTDALWVFPLLWVVSWWVEGPLQRAVNARVR